MRKIFNEIEGQMVDYHRLARGQVQLALRVEPEALLHPGIQLSHFPPKSSPLRSLGPPILSVGSKNMRNDFSGYLAENLKGTEDSLAVPCDCRNLPHRSPHFPLPKLPGDVGALL